MGVSEEVVRVRVTGAKEGAAEFTTFGRAVEKTEQQSRRAASGVSLFGRSADNAHRSFGRLRAAASYGGGLLGLTAVGYGLRDVVTGGQQAQSAQVQLRSALKATGQHGSREIGRLNTEAEKFAQHGGFDTTEQTQQLARFISQTHDANKAWKENIEATDVARRLHLGYGAAVSLVAQAQTGATGRLQRYIGVIQPVTYWVDQLTAKEKKLYPERKKQAEALDKKATAETANQKILESFGGATAQFSKTTEGAVSDANNSWKTLTTELGTKLLPTIKTVAMAFTQVVQEIQKGEGIWKTVGHVITVTWEALKETWKWLEKNKGVAKTLGIIIASVFAVEKVAKFESALRGLNIVKLIAGPAVVAETTVAGSVLGEALIAGLVGYAAAHLAQDLIKKIHVSFDPGKILKGESPFSVSVSKGASDKQAALEPHNRYEEKLAKENFLKHPYKEAGSQLAGPLGRPDPILEHFHKIMSEPPDKGFGNIRPIHLHLHLDSKEIAHSVGQHALSDPQIARKFAEGTTHYTLKQNARRNSGS